jgi:hypothetical protein
MERTAYERVLESLNGADTSSALLAIRLWLSTLPDGVRQNTVEDLVGVCKHPNVQ